MSWIGRIASVGDTDGVDEVMTVGVSVDMEDTETALDVVVELEETGLAACSTWACVVG